MKPARRRRCVPASASVGFPCPASFKDGVAVARAWLFPRGRGVGLGEDMARNSKRVSTSNRPSLNRASGL